MSSIDEVWERMNQSERFGCKFGLFPAWIEDYRLSHDEITELINKSESEISLGVSMVFMADSPTMTVIIEGRPKCPKCGRTDSTVIEKEKRDRVIGTAKYVRSRCLACNYKWTGTYL